MTYLRCEDCNNSTHKRDRVVADGVRWRVLRRNFVAEVLVEMTTQVGLVR